MRLILSEQKILLVNPPQKTELRRILGLNTPPMGLLYIAAYLEEAGLSVEVLDADLYNLSPYQLTNEVTSRNPDIVGVTATTVAIGSAIRVVRSVRVALPNSVIVAGGAHPTFMPRQTLLDCPELDLVVRGEGERTMLELTQALKGFQWRDSQDARQRFMSPESNEFCKRVALVNGIAYRNPENADEVVLTPNRPIIEDLDSIPFPARHLVPFDRYKLLGREVAIGFVMTSRGCPFSCTYCSSSRILGKRYRSRSPENVVHEIELLCDRYHLKHIELIDDIFTLDQKRAAEFSELLRNERLDIRWAASSRVNTVSKETMKTMKKAGLDMLYFGVESGSQRILNLMKKGTTLEQTRTVFRLAKDAKVGLTGSFILGYPGERLDEMWQTIEFCLDLNPDYAQFCILTPYPGTPVYDELKAKQLLMTDDWERYSTLEPVINYDAFGYSHNVLKEMLRNAYFCFYLRPNYMVRHWRLIPRIIKSCL